MSVSILIIFIGGGDAFENGEFFHWF